MGAESGMGGQAATMHSIMPKLIRPRQEFPTPLFRVTVPLLVIAAVALLVWLLAR
jgi:hypothetical protein